MSRWPLAVLLCAAFLVKLIVLWQLKDHPLLQADAGLDTTAYVDLARRVAQGDWLLRPQAYFVSPLYIYFVGAVFEAGGSLTAVRVVQIALGTAAVWFVFVAAREWFGTGAAWPAAILAALTGTLTFNEVLVVQAALDPFLISAALAALALALLRPWPAWFAISGVALGLATLNRPNVLASAVVVVGLLFVLRRAQAAVFLAAALALTLAPVALRNGLVAGDWSPLPTQGGLNFYIGNNPSADGTYRPVPGIRPTIEGQQVDARDVASRAIGRAVGDREASSYFFRQGLDWIRSAPGRAAALFARKLALLFNRAHIVLNYSYPFFAYDARTLLIALPIGAWILLPLGLIGLALGPLQGSRGAFAIWASFVPVYALATAAFFISDRYRLPLLIPMTIASGRALDVMWSAGPRSAASRAGRTVVAALVALFVFVNWPVHVDDGRPEERTRMAERLIQLGDFAGAEHWASLAEEGYPRPAVMHVRIGRQFMRARQWASALAHYDRAAALEPREPEVQYRIGQALVESGRPGAAVAHLRAAVTGNPDLPLAGYDLARALAATGDRDGALAALRAARPSAEDRAQNFVAFGELAMQLRDAGLAEDLFRRAVAESPSLAAARQQLGLVLGVEGRLDEAARELEEAIRLNPGDASSHLNLAVVYAQAGRIAEARSHAQEALRISPGYPQARQLLAALAR